jgi:hypothetical protein
MTIISKNPGYSQQVKNTKRMTTRDTGIKSDNTDSNLLINHLPRSERYEAGKQIRKICPRSSHAKWEAPENRHDPVDLILESNKGRIQKLLPLRHGRMARTLFTFLPRSST